MNYAPESMPIVQISDYDFDTKYDIDTALEMAEQIVIQKQQLHMVSEKRCEISVKSVKFEIFGKKLKNLEQIQKT